MAHLKDLDPIETKEWSDALKSVLKYEGRERAQYLLDYLINLGDHVGLKMPDAIVTPYFNTIQEHKEAQLPEGDDENLQKVLVALYWNAITMVLRAAKHKGSELGGHLSSYMSLAMLYEVGFNYFFHTATEDHGGDLVFFQGHSSPGNYARSFLEGRLDEAMLDRFRQEVGEPGLSSYPHPWLMPDYWQFPTVSMGLGPFMAIYQAHFLQYMHHRGFIDLGNRHVWAFCGDGEMSEPESQGALWLAGREKLDHLTIIINCNLQRLDGPVYGNGQIAQEMEGVFRGAGWHAIKVIWGEGWCELFKKDTKGLLQQRVAKLVDGEYQNYSAKGGAYLREHFFGESPELLALVEDMTDDELTALKDGGHDWQKIYAAFSEAANYKGKPTVILVKTVKGYGLGASGQGVNTAHQKKKMSAEDLLEMRDRFSIPMSDEQTTSLSYYKPEESSPEMQFMRQRREALGGGFPQRRGQAESLTVPELSAFKAQLDGSGDREVSSTMAYVRILSTLLKDKNIGKRVVPIVADESRTFGMEGLFRQVGIYSYCGQSYEPEDKKQLMYYREDQKGQLLQEGLTEAGGIGSWIAAATSYSVSNQPMIPLYIYYSMFGYQRIGDFVWAAGDMRARGFIIGATAGRTTLAGEGLQHQDGHNILMFDYVPNCITYDPTFSYELAVIMQDGLRRMYQEQEDVFYYLTVMNDNYLHPAMPEGAEPNILKGMYLLQNAESSEAPKVQLMGSGAILLEVMKAADILKEQFNVVADIWGVTSFNQLRRDIESVDRYNRLHPTSDPQKSHVEQCLQDHQGPVVAATDYLKVFADQIGRVIDRPYHVLGTNGYGRSDTRAALRHFFEVDAKHIAYTALCALSDEGSFNKDDLLAAQQTLGIDPNKPEPITQ